MEKSKEIRKHILKDVEAFRARQRQEEPSDGEIRKQQYRELREILSPFWAGRMQRGGPHVS